MLKAKFLHSGTNPVWVAAFFSKSLKRAQVLDTDISSAVDKILQDEMDVVSCRVLGYLLLGVVRIYSKKVEYVLHDCEVLVKINKFVINAEDIARVETLRMSITIPDRLELDAFELDALEDAGGGHTAPPEEITLKAKEVVCKTGGFGLFSQEKSQRAGGQQEDQLFCQHNQGTRIWKVYSRNRRTHGNQHVEEAVMHSRGND